MSTIDVRVELPTHSHSFQIQVGHQWTIRQVKETIQRTCKGSPRPDGQRLVWRGRFLKDDETVQDIWKSATDSRIIHLSVHPTAWTGTPPNPTRTLQTSATHTAQQPVARAQQPQPHRRRDAARGLLPPQPVMPPTALPLEFIHNKHNAALHVLTHGHLSSSDPQQVPRANPATRAHAQNVLAMYGYAWPAVLDENYPEPSASGSGVKYEHVVVDNQPYLKLVSPPNVSPNAIQQHALKVLSHTFALLSIAPPDPTIYQPLPHYSPQFQLPTANLNQHLHQLGFPPLRVAPAQNVNQNPVDPNLVALEVRAIPFRALMIPLMMLLFRTLLLIYFFSPSKQPVFGLILSAWIFYEAWGALRHVLGDRPNNNNNNNNNDGEQQQGRAGNAVAREEQPQQAPGQGVAVAGNNRDNNRDQPAIPRTFSDQFLDILSAAKLDKEEPALNGASRPHPPSLMSKTRLFLYLFVATLHPAVWDRRRDALRKREGRLRTEALLRQSPEVDESAEPARYRTRQDAVERHRRRMPWVQTYVERVLNTEYVDDQ